jgi:uncharacterized membrane protein YphA (DoxX/SURF4 family)
VNETLAAAVAWSAQLMVAGTLLVAGAQKLRDLRAARRAIQDYRLLPGPLEGPVVRLLAVAEVVAGTGVLIGALEMFVLAFALLIVFTFAIASALARGFEIDCHCATSSEKITLGTLLRNGALIAALLLAVIRSPSVWSVADRSGVGILLAPLPVAIASGLLLCVVAFSWAATSLSLSAQRLWRQ